MDTLSVQQYLDSIFTNVGVPDEDKTKLINSFVEGVNTALVDAVCSQLPQDKQRYYHTQIAKDPANTSLVTRLLTEAAQSVQPPLVLEDIGRPVVLSQLEEFIHTLIDKLPEETAQKLVEGIQTMPLPMHEEPNR